MAIDDEIQQKLQQLAETSEVSLQTIWRNATIVAGVAFAANQSESLLQSMGILGTAIMAAIGGVGKSRLGVFTLRHQPQDVVVSLCFRCVYLA